MRRGCLLAQVYKTYRFDMLKLRVMSSSSSLEMTKKSYRLSHTRSARSRIRQLGLLHSHVAVLLWSRYGHSPPTILSCILSKGLFAAWPCSTDHCQSLTLNDFAQNGPPGCCSGRSFGHHCLRASACFLFCRTKKGLRSFSGMPFHNYAL